VEAGSGWVVDVLDAEPSVDTTLCSLTAETEFAESTSWAVLSSYKVIASQYLALLRVRDGCGLLGILPERV
jgi:hypothetical protein